MHGNPQRSCPELTIDTSVDIDRPIAEVWAALTDFAAYPLWNPYLVQIEGAAVPGTKLIVHARSGSETPPLVQSVDLESITPFVMLWRGGFVDRDEFAGEHRFELTALTVGQTRLRHYEHFTGSRATAIIDQYGSTILNNFRKFNIALKHYTECTL